MLKPKPCTWREKLRGALERGELSLHYQPQIDMQSGEIAGMAGLVGAGQCWRLQTPILLWTTC